jgi:sodium/bile acid cotransporter 7
VETACIIIIFVISGLVLKTEELYAAIRHPWPLLYGLVAILGITPMLGFATIHLPLQPAEFAIGKLRLALALTAAHVPNHHLI